MPRFHCSRSWEQLSALCISLIIGCAESGGDGVAPDAGEDEVAPLDNLSTGSTCPDNSTLSYENFGRSFFESYCLSCHSAAVSGSTRLAPDGRNFDDLAMIRALAYSIDQFAAAGPRGEHQSMPPGGQASPTLEQRTQLGEWLACGAPR